MARKRNPNRDEAKARFLESGGAISTKELADLAGVPESRIRKWKSEDGWKSRNRNGGAGHSRETETRRATARP